MSPQPAKQATPQPKKKVLLVQSIGPHRTLRASVMRKRGFDVVCAADCAEARLLWHPAAYDLVLLDGLHDSSLHQELCRDMKASCPTEKIAFLVGKPELLSSIPGCNGVDIAASRSRSYQHVFGELMTKACEALPHRHGFMEAVWRMYLLKSSRPPVVATKGVPVIPVTKRQRLEPSIPFGEAVRQAELETEANDVNTSA